MYKIPKHIAIIMDGNRRWAERNKVSKHTGHKKGASSLKNIISEQVLGMPQDMRADKGLPFNEIPTGNK